MLNKLINRVKRHKKQLKTAYVVLIVAIIIYSVYSICERTSWASVVRTFRNLSWSKSIVAVILGAVAVIPMVIYDFIYTRKTQSRVSFPELFKNSYIINSFTNAGGSGGLVGASLRVYLFGKASKKTAETVKIVSQIALFTLVGLITNDIIAILLNLHTFFKQPLLIRWACLLFPLYIFVPFFVPSKKLNFKDHFWLVVGSSLEWLFALGFFISVGFLMGVNFNAGQVYLAVAFAGIVGAISMIPGGVGSFDSAIILGMSQLGISTGVAVTWAFIYRICYYIIPFIIGMVFLLFTVARRKLTNK